MPRSHSWEIMLPRSERGLFNSTLLPLTTSPYGPAQSTGATCLLYVPSSTHLGAFVHSPSRLGPGKGLSCHLAVSWYISGCKLLGGLLLHSPCPCKATFFPGVDLKPRSTRLTGLQPTQRHALRRTRRCLTPSSTLPPQAHTWASPRFCSSCKVLMNRN